MNLPGHSFAASAFAPDWGNELFAGQVCVTSAGLDFTAEPGALHIPLARLVAEVRCGDEDRVTFTDTAVPGVEVFAADLEVLDSPLPPLVRARAEFAERLGRRDLRRRVRVLAWCVALCIAVTLIATHAMSFMVRAIANRVPPQWDAKYGASVMRTVADEHEFVNDSNRVARLRALAAPLLRVLPPLTNGYQFHVLKDDEPNAFALPGGHIVIHTGLLELMDQPEELLGVIAHEAAHVSERHIYRSHLSTAGPLIVCSIFLGGQGGAVELLGTGAALMVGAGFSQEYETEADLTGWNYLVQANINPRGFIQALQKLKLYSRDHAGADHLPQAFQSHPEMEKRIRRLEKRWAKLRVKTGFLTLEPLPPAKP